MKRRPWLALALCCVPALVLACGGDGQNDTLKTAATIAEQTRQAGGTPSVPVDTTTSPQLTEPVSRYTVLHEDVGAGFRNITAGTFNLDIESYAATNTFPSADVGRDRLSEWAYLEGFEESLVPDAGDSSLLNGMFKFTVESHLFANEGGARQAFSYFESIVRANKKAQPVTLDPLGNQAAAFMVTEGTFEGTNTEIAYHRVIFRRGNLVVVVQTTGAASFMTIQDAFALATLIDQKALGNADAAEPTPVANYTPPAGSSGPTPPGLTPESDLTPQTATR